MKMSNLNKTITKIATVLELVLAIALVIAVLIGMVDVVKYIGHIFNADFIDTYDVFKSFLGFTFLLVIGIEFVLMLIAHSPNAILELVLFVIARKMLIYSENMLDLLLATIAIVGVFAIKKFLTPHEAVDKKREKEHMNKAAGDYLKNPIKK